MIVRRPRFLALAPAVVALALACTVAVAQVEVEEDRQHAAPVAGPGKVLDVQGKVLDVVGVTLGVEGVLRDLGAKVTPQEIRIELAADVLFDFDSAELRPDAVASLGKVVTVIDAYPAAPVLIEGHTDARGADDYNLKLSQARAASVERWLVAKGKVADARITTKGLGETRPKAPNEKPDGSDDPAGRQANRRVEIVIRKG